jgi:8-oxo-dGTP pyrophosphatase MutT (NUDIX family)
LTEEIADKKANMNLIKTIRDKDIGVDSPVPSNYVKRREASRAIVFDKEKNIALLNVTKKNFHKLPGGGIEEGEDVEAALRREVLEEIGCSIENIRELGIVEEYRGKFELHQISYCFLADIRGEKGSPSFEGDEIEDGFQPVWVNFKDAIKTLEGEVNVEDYEGKFIHLRDLTLLREAAKMK